MSEGERGDIREKWKVACFATLKGKTVVYSVAAGIIVIRVSGFALLSGESLCNCTRLGVAVVV